MWRPREVVDCPARDKHGNSAVIRTRRHTFSHLQKARIEFVDGAIALGQTGAAMKYHLLTLCLIALHSAIAEDMQKYMQETRSLEGKGKYQEALDRHLWFHDHALEHDEAMYGVRLSFALMAWQELGKKYPPAAKALVDTRDKKAQALREGKGSKETFHDVLALDRTLEKPAETIRLFEEVTEKHPNQAAEYWRFVKDTVLDEKRFDLARKHIKDVPQEFAKSVKAFKANKQLYSDPNAGGPRFQAYNEDRLVKEALQLIDLALATGDRTAAIQIQKEATSLVPDSRLTDAVPPAPEGK
jgi:hypothetical protein